MSLRKSILSSTDRDTQFNMTAMIDIVFLLIIFFMLVCQFITRENYQLILPDACPAALVPDTPDENAVTVSVFRDAKENQLTYAVRGRTFTQTEHQQIVTDLANEIRSETARKKQAVVHLRAHADLGYIEVQTALEALARAGVQRVQLAAYRTEQDTPTNPGEVTP